MTASPPGEAMGAARQMVFHTTDPPSNFGRAFLYPTTIDFPPSRFYNRHRQKNKEEFTMQADPNVLKLIQELSDAPGASGFEDEVVAVARRW